MLMRGNLSFFSHKNLLLRQNFPRSLHPARLCRLLHIKATKHCQVPVRNLKPLPPSLHVTRFTLLWRASEERELRNLVPGSLAPRTIFFFSKLNYKMYKCGA